MRVMIGVGEGVFAGEEVGDPTLLAVLAPVPVTVSDRVPEEHWLTVKL